jgi:hypothetical protein
MSQKKNAVTHRHASIRETFKADKVNTDHSDVTMRVI